MFAIGDGEDTRGGLARLLFGRSISFEIYGDSPITVEAPITYQRAQYICHVAPHWFYLPKIGELWNVPIWTKSHQEMLEAREAKTGPLTVYHAWALPAFVPKDRYKPHPLLGFV